MATLDPESIDAVVCDPPYGLEFMGKDWDKFAPTDPVRRSGWEHSGTSARVGDEDGAEAFGRVAFGKRRATSKCSGCGKRDGFRNPHECVEDAEWLHEWVDAAPLEALSFQEFSFRWATEAFRVLKPGGHALAFGGTRMYHRLAVGLEDAGFEIRDSLHWIYGSGFPKSLDVSKALDKRRDEDAMGVRREVILTVTAWVAKARDAAGVTNKQIDDAFGMNGMAGHWTSSKSQPSVPRAEYWPQLLALLLVEEPPEDVRAAVDEWLTMKGQPAPTWSLREVTGHHDRAAPAQTWMASNGLPANLEPRERRDVPASEAAERWLGWGTALKPAHEPILLARKPLAGTVAETVLRYGTGALNVAASRIGTAGGTTGGALNDNWRPSGSNEHPSVVDIESIPAGRWPPNVLLAHLPECQGSGPNHTELLCASGCPVAELNEASGESVTPAAVTRGAQRSGQSGLGELGRQDDVPCFGDSGGAARFFYVAKPKTRERVGGTVRNLHPTVKPIDLMRYLVRLVTPPGGAPYCPTCDVKCTNAFPPDTDGAVPSVRPNVRGRKSSRPGEEVLQPDMRVAVAGGDEVGTDQDVEGIHRDPPADPSLGIEGGIRDGAPSGGGEGDRAAPKSRRGRPSPERREGRQPTRQSSGNDEGPARQKAEAPADVPVSSLRRADRGQKSERCPRCDGPLALRPPGVVLDPFMGSGSTGCAAMVEGFRFVGVEQDADSFATARARIADYAFAHGRGHPEVADAAEQC